MTAPGTHDGPTHLRPLPHALACARLGWLTFPVLPRDKRPDGQLAPHGCKDASCDPDQLHDWFADRPGHNLGLSCGPSGLVVVDVDPRNGGLESMGLLTSTHGQLPVTVTAETGGGGYHFLFSAPRDDDGHPVRLRPQLAPGIDLKGAGGYIVIAPSLHPSGHRYQWSPVGRPSQRRPAELPAWVLDLARVPDAVPVAPRPPSPRGGAAPVDRASRYLARLDASVSGAGGHQALWTAAHALVVGFALSEADALGLLAAEFNPRCQPPWSLDALRHKVTSAARQTRTAAGWLLDAPRRR